MPIHARGLVPKLELRNERIRDERDGEIHLSGHVPKLELRNERDAAFRMTLRNRSVVIC
jgi:hypothetical protein